jgi:hypothetical protein
MIGVGVAVGVDDPLLFVLVDGVVVLGVGVRDGVRFRFHFRVGIGIGVGAGAGAGACIAPI